MKWSDLSATAAEASRAAQTLAFVSAAIARLLRRDTAITRAELEFLPAALEVLESPASPVGRSIGAVIVLLFAVAVFWASVGHVDIIAIASGRIVPTGRTKVIQPLEAGTVTAINVKDGDRVKEGQALIEIDRTVSTAERNRIGHELLHARLDVARLKALRARIEASAGLADFEAPPEASMYQVARTRAAMVAQLDQQAAKLASLDQQIMQKRAEAEEVATVIAKLNASLPLVEETAGIREKVMRMEFGNRVAYLDAQLKLIETRHELTAQQRRAAEVAAAIKALEWEQQRAKAEYAQGIVTDLADAEQKAGQLAEDMRKADKRIKDQTLRAPIDGTVQQLVIHTVGGVVTPAQALMVIVPEEDGVEIEATVPNRDIGFVHEGDEAEIKVDTFNFTKYGLLHGKVLSISRDAVIRDKSNRLAVGDKQGAQSDASSEPPGQELNYVARVSLDRTRMQIEDKNINLEPGMAVTVEIKTGRRRIIEYVLSPILRYRQESLRER
ncbi:MAG TPA: HlyD family type I secretion periplasmic adaptor subunit [Pseudolabrys sp.]|nr:HlyD family type I secretion periplasmic adaptor subunit [Pseudolabrys sp.]